MSTGIGPNPPEAPPLRFDRAEHDGAEGGPMLACAGCKGPIADVYYRINGSTFCQDCREGVERYFRGGSRLGRLFRATVFGSAAAALGGSIYFAVYHFFHVQAALISILCGFLVGRAVRAGSDGRGGRIYQAMAIGMTYLAIGAAKTAGIFAAAGVGRVIGQLRAEFPGFSPAGHAAILASVMAWMAVRMPILIAKGNILSGAFVAFALWEAGKLTKKARIVIEGPFDVDPPGEVIDVEPAPEFEADAEHGAGGRFEGPGR